MRLPLLHNNKAVKRHFWSCLLFLLSANLFAVDYFVSENGSNSNAGTSESEPFLTIAKAMNSVSPGDTVYVMNGTYRNTGYGSGIDGSDLTNGNVVRITASGSEGAYITLRNLEGHKPKIQFDGAGGINLAPNTSYIIIEGFEVEGPSQFITYDQAIADRNYKIFVIRYHCYLLLRNPQHSGLPPTRRPQAPPARGPRGRDPTTRWPRPPPRTDTSAAAGCPSGPHAAGSWSHPGCR